MQIGAPVLIADDGDFGGGDFEAHEAVGGVEVKIDFEVGGGDAKAFVGFSVEGGRPSGFGGDGAGHEFLRDENAESLRAALGPVVKAGEDGVLVVEIVVEDGDERRVEREGLIEGVGALHLQGHFR